MTASAVAPAHFRASAKSEARRKKQALQREIEEMSEAMRDEEGLLNHPQAALLLEVSTRRVSELVELGKLSRFDFLGRTYVSMRQIKARREQDLKAGRPRRNLVQKIVTGVKAAAKTDAAQALQGGFAGPYEKAKARGKLKKRGK